MLTVGSFFSGIEGFALGLERAGMRVLWHCEQDDYCQRVIRKHWPHNPIYPDMRTLRGADVEPVRVVCGGFPCQDISGANPNAVGIDGARSGLWSEYLRLISELRPDYVIVENVSALLGRGLGRVLGDLAAIGYDAEWDCIPASAVGAPHQRDRIWLIAYPHADTRRLEVGEERDSEPQRPGLAALLGRDADGLRDDVADAPRDAQARPAPEARPQRQRTRTGGEHRGTGEVAHTAGAGRSEPRSIRPAEAPGAGPLGIARGSGWWEVEPAVGRVADGIPNRVDRLSALGNALVPQIAEWIGRRIIEWEEGEVAA